MLFKLRLCYNDKYKFVTQHFNQPPSHSTRQNGDGSNMPLETRHVRVIGILYLFYFILFYYYTNVYFRLIYLIMTAWEVGINGGLRHDVFRALSYVFFFIIYIFNYTNGYLKVLYLQMETLGMAGKADGGWR